MNPKDLIKNKEEEIDELMEKANKEEKRDIYSGNLVRIHSKLKILESELEALKQMNKLWKDKLKDEGIMFHEGKLCFDEKASPKFAKWLDKLLDKREKATNKLWHDRIDEFQKRINNCGNLSVREVIEGEEEGVYKTNAYLPIINEAIEELKSEDKNECKEE